MKKHTKSCIAALLLLICLWPAGASADGILMSWSASTVPGVDEQAFNAAKQLSVAAILEKNVAARSWPDAFLLMVGATQHKDDKTLLKGLAAQLTNTTKADLKQTNRLIIWERITSGEIQFEGKGYQVNDDLFLIAGRANWILRNLTKKTFGYVKPSTSAAYLAQLSDRWQRWLNGETVLEYQDPYATGEKGLTEIRSLEALEALIVSLKPAAEKDKLIRDCLKRIYHTEKLPDDPNSQEALCGPDPYTLRYLTVITGIKERHDYSWWNDWWHTNQKKLSWNREKGAFEIAN